MTTCRLTMAQALICYLQAQYVERDGEEQPFLRDALGSLAMAMWLAWARLCSRRPSFRIFFFAMSKPWSMRRWVTRG